MEISPNTTQLIFEKARELGFVRTAVAAASELNAGDQALQGWLHNGFHGEMDYMARHGRRDIPENVLKGAKSLLVVALPYANHPEPPPPSRPHGFVARYARGEDYHLVMRQKLTMLAEACAKLIGQPVLSRPCVDTAPLLEREYAAQAGLGFVAKNTMLLIPGFGSYFLLGELLLNVELPPSLPIEARCGSCTACLDACPTGAFVSARVLDARKCISYFTIEFRGTIPLEYRKAMGNMVFGCDICQEVCPFNASSQPRPAEPALEPKPGLLQPNLVGLLTLSSGDHRRLGKNTALRRIPRPQLMRNAAIALGNSGDPQVIPDLQQSLHTNPYPLVRGHVAWALGELGAREILSQALPSEPEPEVRAEILGALKRGQHE